MKQTTQQAYYWLLSNHKTVQTVIDDQAVSTQSIDLLTLNKAGSATLLIPSSSCLSLHLALPKQIKPNQYAQIIPFQCEDLISQDINQCHFAHTSHSVEGKVSVWVCDKNYFNDCIKSFELASLNAVYPDFCGLPLHDKAWTLLIQEHHCLLRQSAHQGCYIDNDNLDIWLAAFKSKNAAAMPKKLVIYQQKANSELSKITEDYFEQVEINSINEPLLNFLIRHLNTHQSINLLQGKFKVKPQTKQYRVIAIAAAILLTVWFGLTISTQLLQHQRLQAQSAALKSEITTLYKKVFPNAKQVISPRLRIERELNKLGGLNADNEFLTMLTAVGQQLNKKIRPTIYSADYSNGALVIEFVSPSSKLLQQLVEVLEQKGFTVQREDSKNNEKKAITRLTIQEQQTT